MSSRCTTLTIGDKMNIMKALKTRSPVSLAGDYNVSLSTIYRIKAKKGEIIEAVKKSVTQKRIVEIKYPSIKKTFWSGLSRQCLRTSSSLMRFLKTQVLQYGIEQHIDDFKAGEMQHTFVLSKVQPDSHPNFTWWRFSHFLCFRVSPSNGRRLE